MAEPPPPVYHIREINSWEPERRKLFLRYSIQVGADHHAGHPQGATTPGDYMNHSCDPTAWFDAPFVMSARRELARGDEITFDYAMSEIREDFGLPECRCGTPLCRGRITPTDVRDHPALYERYGRHMLPHVLEAAGILSGRDRAA